jgi:hypothetical protein
MPLVFVHGVNVRRGKSQKDAADFDERVKTRDELFRSVSLGYLSRDATKLRIENPYWGDHGATFRYDLVTVPARDTEAFGSADGDLLADVFFDTIPADVAELAQDPQQTESKVLLTLARERSIDHAVDAVVAAAAVNGSDDSAGGAKLGSAEDLAAFAANAAAYVASKPDVGWLRKPDPGTKHPLETDDQFLEVLVERVTAHTNGAPSHETFGGMKIGERLKAAGRALGRAGKKVGSVVADTVKGTGAAAGGFLLGGLAGGPANPVTKKAALALRPQATRRGGIFIGDIFAYLARREPIQKIVSDALLACEGARTKDDPTFVVVAHSMGGNIVYDLLTSTLAKQVKVDAFITVGSQVGLFKELALYTEDAPNEVQTATAATAVRNAKPAAVGRWINVFDPLDFLGFAASGVFKEVQDYAFSNDASVLQTHSQYFVRPAFHERLRARLEEAGFGAVK